MTEITGTKTRRILFLDFDGVLSSDRYLKWRRESEGEGYLEAARLETLRRIIDETGAEIVLSTSWREHWDPDGGNECWKEKFAGDLQRFGLEIVDRTPEIKPWDRAGEVGAWLEAHREEVFSFVILDDQTFRGWKDLTDRFVKTAGYRGGITEAEADRAIELLKTPLV